MKSKILFQLCCLCGCCISVVACNNQGQGAIASLYYAYSTENLMSDWNYLLEKDEDGDPIEMNIPFIGRDYTLRFDCLKNENEGAQLIIHANRYIDKFDFSLPDVTDGTNVISKDNFSVAAAWYQNCYGTNEYDAYAGWYPDALIPLDSYKFRRMNHIEEDRNQALYVNFVSTKSMRAGTYTGTGVLTLDNQKFNIPFEVTIYDAEMCDEVHQASAYLMWYEQIPIGEKDNFSVPMLKDYYDFVLTKRITPDALPDSYEQSPELFAENIYKYVANNPKITSYRMPIQSNSYSKEKVYSYLKAVVEKNFALRAAGDNTTDLIAKLFFYIDDEPTSSTYPKVKQHDKEIFDTKKALLADPTYSLEFAKYPDLKESLGKVKNLVTREFDPYLVATNEEGGIQTWCPQFSYFQSESSRQLYRDRQLNTAGDQREFGENVWWYGCMDPQSPYPSFHLNADLITSRVVRYMRFDYYIEGEIFWCTSYYSKYSHGVTVARDVWNDPISWENCAGDGYLLYPGVEFGIYGPITTLRAESILAGNEEYEYLYYIDQKVQEYNAANSTNYDSRTLMNKYFSRIYKDMKPYVDHKEFNDVRLEILSIVQAFNLNINSGMAMLLAD